MTFRWTKESINWYANASEYCNFHSNLAKVVSSVLDKDDSLLDIGCGLGFLDIELSQYVKNITALDMDSNVINYLSHYCERNKVSNISALCDDFKNYKEKHSVVLMSFFGRDGQMEYCYSRCEKKLIRIVNWANEGNMYPNKYRKRSKSSVPMVDQILKESKKKYQLIDTTLEFGQPLVSIDDGIAFVKHNAPDASEKEIRDFLEKKSEKSELDKYDFYLPNKKRIGIFVIEV